jgi:hypothetical protein
VATEGQLAITFSESMEPRSTEEAVALAPRVDVRKRQWSGRTLTLTLAGPLREHQTYTLFVGGTARDRHGNPMAAGRTLVFSTGDSFPRGRIAGRIEPRGLNAEGIALWCYDQAQGRAPDSTARDFDALGLADKEGDFRVDGLAVPGRYRLWAFADLNHNRSFEPASDVLVPLDTTFALTPERPVVDSLDVRVVNPRASGTVKGAVLDSLADTSSVIRIVAISERDTSRRVVVAAELDGSFELQLEPGAWTLWAFRDLDGDQIWQRDVEPASNRIKIELEPAGEIIDIRIHVEGISRGP